MRELTDAEREAIDRFPADKVTKPKNGEWPDCDRIEVMRYVSPALRAMVKRQKAEAEKKKGKKT